MWQTDRRWARGEVGRGVWRLRWLGVPTGLPVRQGKERLHVAWLGSGLMFFTPHKTRNRSPGGLSAVSGPSCILMVVGLDLQEAK